MFLKASQEVLVGSFGPLLTFYNVKECSNGVRTPKFSELKEGVRLSPKDEYIKMNLFKNFWEHHLGTF